MIVSMSNGHDVNNSRVTSHDATGTGGTSYPRITLWPAEAMGWRTAWRRCSDRSESDSNLMESEFYTMMWHKTLKRVQLLDTRRLASTALGMESNRTATARIKCDDSAGSRGSSKSCGLMFCDDCRREDDHLADAVMAAQVQTGKTIMGPRT